MIIFLDIDGVLNQLQKDYVDGECVKNLAILVEKLNARVVLISTWRLGYTHERRFCSPQIKILLDKFYTYDLEIYSRTGKLLDNRTDEIMTYLQRDNDDYIILDDDASLYTNHDNLYLVNHKTGLTMRDVKKISKEYKYVSDAR